MAERGAPPKARLSSPAPKTENAPFAVRFLLLEIDRILTKTTYSITNNYIFKHFTFHYTIYFFLFADFLSIKNACHTLA